MCDDPKTFTHPETGWAVEVACRTCNACISARRFGWEARGVAELQDWPFAYAITLSYNDDTEANRDSAAFFAYTDVRDFVKKLLSAARDKKPGAKVRFIVAGEQGDEYGRCHWHTILYSDVDLLKIGEFKGMKRGKKVVLTEKTDLITVHRGRKIRLDWDKWGRGFVVVQDANQDSIRYAISYCLKDQFTVEKSRDTAREAQAENFATGLFRTSKYPPIGWRWLSRKMENLLASGQCLPNLNISIPGLRGYWSPTGGMRKVVLWYQLALYQATIWRTGNPPAQWGSFVASLSENETDMEFLQNGTSQIDGHSAYLWREQETDRRFGIDGRKDGPGCFCQAPCGPCIARLSPHRLQSAGIRRGEAARPDWGVTLEYFESAPGYASLYERQKAARGERNPFCYFSGRPAR